MKMVKVPSEVLGITTITSLLQLTRYVLILRDMFFPYLPLDITTSAGRQEVCQSVESYTFGEIKWMICHKPGCVGCLSYKLVSVGKELVLSSELNIGLHLKLQSIVLFGALNFPS